MNEVQSRPKGFELAKEQALVAVEEPPGIRKPSVTHKDKQSDARDVALAAAYRYILAQGTTSVKDQPGEGS